MARDYKRDYNELPDFSKKYIGYRTLTCIEEYAKLRKIVEHRVGSAFWSLVDEGKIKVTQVGQYYYIAE